MKPLLVIGSQGQLARALAPLCPDAIFLDRAALDLAHPQAVPGILDPYDPSAVINAAAYTQVDKAEQEEALAHAVNASSPAEMAAYCALKRIPFVHFSTDYVFDGSGEKPWKEDDVPKPLNAYGRSKLAGEKAIARAGGRYLIFRTSWLYDAASKNFPNAILRLAAEREALRVINDQYGAPTYGPHLAANAFHVLQSAMKMDVFPSGIYHLCNSGVTTWYGFACAIVAHARRLAVPLKVRDILPIPASGYPLPALRPHNSRLDCSKALSMFGIALPSWQDGLKECMESKR